MHSGKIRRSEVVITNCHYAIPPVIPLVTAHFSIRRSFCPDREGERGFGTETQKRVKSTMMEPEQNRKNVFEKLLHYRRHLRVLEKAKDQDLDNEFIVSGIINKFFIQFELGWKVLKELLTYEGGRVGRQRFPARDHQAGLPVLSLY